MNYKNSRNAHGCTLPLTWFTHKFHYVLCIVPMSLNAIEIGIVTDVFMHELLGAVARKVISPAIEGRVVLQVRTAGQNQLLQFVLQPPTMRIGRILSKPKVASSPHPFVMLLRKELGSMAIEKFEQLGNDRVVKIGFVGRERKGAIVCELSSRYSNLFWLDKDDLIKGSFFVNRCPHRKLIPGQPYVLPPVSTKAPTEPRFKPDEDIEQKIEEHYQDLEDRRSFELSLAWTQRLINTATKQTDRLLNRLEQDMAKASEADKLSMFGHLLKANLKKIKKGITQIEVVDFEGNHVVLSLDPKLGPIENMEKMFAKAKRLRRACSMIEKRQDKILDERVWIEDLQSELTNAPIERHKQIREQIAKRFPNLAHQAKAPKQAKPERLPYREFAIAAGRPARVGRSAADNDTLTLRHAKPNDLWLHVRGMPGSHVVVPMGRGEDPTPQLLVDAAHLAAHFSTAKDYDDVEIIYTRRRYVQKPKGSSSGSVRLLKEKTLILKVEKERLKKIMHP